MGFADGPRLRLTLTNGSHAEVTFTVTANAYSQAGRAPIPCARPAPPCTTRTRCTAPVAGTT